MIVPTLCALLALGPGADPRPTLEARYRQYNAAVLRNDARGMVAWFEKYSSPGFKYTSKDGHTYGRADFLKGLRDQAKAIEAPLKSTLKVTSVSTKGDKAIATIATEFEGKVKFDNVPLRLVDKSVTKDTWVRGKAGWAIARSVQIDADTQMFGG